MKTTKDQATSPYATEPFEFAGQKIHRIIGPDLHYVLVGYEVQNENDYGRRHPEFQKQSMADTWTRRLNEAYAAGFAAALAAPARAGRDDEPA